MSEGKDYDQSTLKALQAKVKELTKKVDDLRAEKEDHDATSGIDKQNRDDIRSAEIKSRRLLKGHFGKVYALHWAGVTNKEQVVSASQDGKLIVWNALSTCKVNAIPLRSSWVMTCAFEQKGNQLIASGGLDNLCSIYNLSADTSSNARANKELSDHDGYLSCCRFIDKNSIITSSGDSTCIDWDIERGDAIHTYPDHAGDVMSISVCPTNENIFCSGSCDMTVCLWDRREKKRTHHFEGHESDINSVDFMQNGLSIATGSDDSSCRIFDIRAYNCIGEYTNDRIVCGITSVSLSKSGRILFSGYDDSNAISWDTLEGKYETLKSGTTPSHDNRVSCIGMNSDGTAVGTGSWDMLLKVWA